MSAYELKLLLYLLAASAVGFAMAWGMRRNGSLKLRSQIDGLHSSLSDREKRLSAIGRERERLAANLASVQNESDSLHKRVAMMEKLVAAERKRSTLLEATVVAERHTRQQTELVRGKEFAQFEEIEADRQTLMEQLRVSQDNMQRIRQQLEDREADLYQSKTTLDSLAEDLAAEHERQQRQQVRLAELESELRREREQHQHSQEQAEQTAGSLAQTLTHLAALEAEKDNLERKLRAALTRLERHAALTRRNVMAACDDGLASGPAARCTTQPRHALSPPRQYDHSPDSVDDLKRIRGIGPAMEQLLNSLGVYQISQVASWTDTDIDFFDQKLEHFRGRIRREGWVESARVLLDLPASGAQTEAAGDAAPV